MAVWVAAHAILVLIATRWWLGHNELPDGYQNEFIHLYTLGEIVFRMRDDSFADALPFIRDEYWPPLIHLLPGLAMAIFEPSRALVTWVAGLAVVPLLAASAAIALRLGGVSAACIATSLIAGAPMIFGNARRYEPNILLAALVMVALWLVVTRERRTDRSFILGLGLVAGLGLLADRVVFAVHLAPVAVVLMARERQWRRWLGVGVVAAVVSGWYYARFLALHVTEVTSQLGGEVAADGEHSAIALFSLRGLLYYPLTWLDGGAGLVPTLLILVGLALWARARRDAGEPLEILLVGGLVIFTLIGKKQPYYGIPLLAPAIVLASVGWTRFLQGRSGTVAVVAAGALALQQIAVNTAGSGMVPAPGRWAALWGAPVLPDGFLGNEYVQAAPPAPGGLDPDRIAATCGPLGPTVLYSEGRGGFEGQLMPTLRLALDTRRVPGLVMEPEAFLESLPAARCFVFVSPSVETPTGLVPAGWTWPTEQSLGRILQQWTGQDPSPELLAALKRARAGAGLTAQWVSERGETVSIYALAHVRGPDLP